MDKDNLKFVQFVYEFVCQWQYMLLYKHTMMQKQLAGN